MSIVKLFAYKTVKCEVVNVEFLTRDLPLKNSAIMVKRKCLNYIHQKECWIDSQSEKLIHSPVLSDINNNSFSSFG